MTKAALKNKILKAINEVEDKRVLKVIYHLVSCHLKTENFELSDEDKADLDERMDHYKAYPEEGFSWEEVKERVRSRRIIN